MHTEVFVLGLAFVRDYSLKRHLHKIVRIVYVALKIVSYILLALAARSKMPTAFRCIAARRRACRVNSSSHSTRCCQTGRNVSVGKSTGMLVAGPSHPLSLDSAKFEFALIFFWK